MSQFGSDTFYSNTPFQTINPTGIRPEESAGLLSGTVQSTLRRGHEKFLADQQMGLANRELDMESERLGMESERLRMDQEAHQVSLDAARRQAYIDRIEAQSRVVNNLMRMIEFKSNMAANAPEDPTVMNDINDARARAEDAQNDILVLQAVMAATSEGSVGEVTRSVFEKILSESDMESVLNQTSRSMLPALLSDAFNKKKEGGFLSYLKGAVGIGGEKKSVWSDFADFVASQVTTSNNREYVSANLASMLEALDSGDVGRAAAMLRGVSRMGVDSNRLGWILYETGAYMNALSDEMPPGMASGEAMNEMMERNRRAAMIRTNLQKVVDLARGEDGKPLFEMRSRDNLEISLGVSAAQLVKAVSRGVSALSRALSPKDAEKVLLALSDEGDIPSDLLSELSGIEAFREMKSVIDAITRNDKSGRVSMAIREKIFEEMASLVRGVGERISEAEISPWGRGVSPQDVMDRIRAARESSIRRIDDLTRSRNRDRFGAVTDPMRGKWGNFFDKAVSSYMQDSMGMGW